MPLKFVATITKAILKILPQVSAAIAVVILLMVVSWGQGQTLLVNVSGEIPSGVPESEGSFVLRYVVTLSAHDEWSEHKSASIQ
jgi:hypothetical protein